MRRPKSFVAALKDARGAGRRPEAAFRPAAGTIEVDCRDVRRMPAQAGTSVQSSPCHRVRTTIRFSNGRQAASEAVILSAPSDEPYRVLSWQDDVEMAAAAHAKRRGP